MDLVHIGDIVKPHGLRGEVCVDLHVEASTLPARAVFVGRDAGDAAERRIAGRREHQGRILLLLEDVGDRTTAEGLRGLKLFLRRADLPEPDPDEIYCFELVGCQVFLEDGSLLGEIAEVLDAGGQEVWSITAADGREVLFPVQEQFVAEADPDRKRVVILPPPGLLELYLPPLADQTDGGGH